MKAADYIFLLLNSKKICIPKKKQACFLRFAEKNGLAGLLYKHGVSAEVKELFHRFYIGNVQRNMVLFAELKRIISCCGRNVVLLKGFSILHFTGQDLGERFLSDIDLLALGDAESIAEKIKSLGYTERANYDDRIYAAHFHHHKPLVKTVSGIRVMVEVHHQLSKPTAPFFIPADELDIQRIAFTGVSIRSMSPEDLFVLICTHTAYDDLFFMGVRSLLDIKLLAKNLSWKKVVDKSKRWGCSSFVYTALLQSRDLLGAKVPFGVLKKLLLDSRASQLLVLSLAKNNLFRTNRCWSLTEWVFKLLLARNMRERCALARNGLLFLRFKSKKI